MPEVAATSGGITRGPAKSLLHDKYTRKGMPLTDRQQSPITGEQSPLEPDGARNQTPSETVTARTIRLDSKPSDEQVQAESAAANTESRMQSTRAPASAGKTDKGNVTKLRGTDGELKKAVTVDVACRFGGVGRRAIEKAVKKGSLESEGEYRNRRILVQSLLKYFPPEIMRTETN
jgi:hypothetical protein